jgi:hypothetical protein
VPQRSVTTRERLPLELDALAAWAEGVWRAAYELDLALQSGSAAQLARAVAASDPRACGRALREIRLAISGLPHLGRSLRELERRIDPHAPREAEAEAVPPSCGYCGGPVVGRRLDARYCSAAHRQAAYRLRRDE